MSRTDHGISAIIFCQISSYNGEPNLVCFVAAVIAFFFLL